MLRGVAGDSSNATSLEVIMAISGTFAAADALPVNVGDLGVDIGSTGTFVASETWVTSVTETGGEVPTTREESIGGVAVVSTGNKAMRVVTVIAFYTEGDTDLFENMWDLHQNATGSYACDVRWSKDGATGSNLFTTSAGKLVSCTAPVYVASNSDTQKFTFVIHAEAVNRTEAA